MIYFIQSKSDGRIKIGSSANPDARLKQLQTGSSDELILLGTLPGSENEEKALHEIFVQHRTNGEWFFPAKEIFDFINNPIGELLKLKSKTRLPEKSEKREIPERFAASAGAQCDCGGYDFGPYLRGEENVFIYIKGSGYHRDTCPILTELRMKCDPELSKIVNGEPILVSTFVNMGGGPQIEHVPWTPEELEEIKQQLQNKHLQQLTGSDASCEQQT
jgi:hypothetical protein